MNYLNVDKEGNSRILAFDCIGMGDPEEMETRWAAVMDSTRVLCGNDTPWRGKPCVTYQHYVISPDPRDGVSLETLRSLTMQWAQELFGTQVDPGTLGSYQVAIVYHDDNDKGIPHAHVIVNNTNLDTGTRLHLDDKQNRSLTDRLQEICKDHGLSYFDDEDPEKHIEQTEGRYYTKQERKILRMGNYSWKQDIANNVVVARRLTRSEPEFIAACKKLGINVEENDGDYVFSHFHNSARWRCSGYRLGANYTRAAILEKLGENQSRFDESLATLKENVTRDILKDLFANMELVAVVEHSITVRDVARTLKINDQYKIFSQDDYRKRIQLFEGQARTTHVAEKRARLKSQLEDVRFAESVALRGDFFLNVDLSSSSVPYITPVAGSSGGHPSSDTRKNDKSGGYGIRPQTLTQGGRNFEGYGKQEETRRETDKTKSNQGRAR